jgi:cytosine/adenosine deaminase-related metal-dependent hydrolase
MTTAIDTRSFVIGRRAINLHSDKMITVNGARALGLLEYGLEPGCRADLVV